MARRPRKPVPRHSGQPAPRVQDTLVVLPRLRSLDPRFVVAELNGEPLVRGRYDEVRLAEGDRLELVRAVAGG